MRFPLANKEVPTHLQRGAIPLAKAGEYDDDGCELHINAEDDEYRWAGVEDPKVVLTTSYNPSSKLKEFSKVSQLLSCY
jgi:U3 small nucleolar ribonucleoprotein protein IMP4